MAKEKKEKPKHPPKSIGGHIREWLEIIIMAFVLAMFIRTFVIELFRIPTGSMVPTLLGATVAEVDMDDDGDEDLVVYTRSPYSSVYEIFVKEGDEYVDVYYTSSLPFDKQIEVSKGLHEQKDMILVNKSAYWFRRPKRGDVVVFRVPEKEFQPEKPIYIKRVAGLPGEKIEIKDSRLYIEEQKVIDPALFTRIKYTNQFGFQGTIVPEDHIYAFGDNSLISADSRKWGGVPLENIKGKAFFRYFPLNQMKFIR
jgi:signal peptidase I